MTRIGGRLGVIDNLDVEGGVHPTAASYGVLGIDTGARLGLHACPKWALALSTRLSFFVGEGGARLLPEAGLHGSTRLFDQVDWLWGSQVMTPLVVAEEHPVVLASLYQGVEWGAVGGRMSALLSWVSPWENAQGTAELFPGNAGALVFTVGMQWVL